MAAITKRRWKSCDCKTREAWRVGYTDREGKRRFEQYATKKGVDARRVQIEGELSRGVHVADAATITVSEACDLWIKTGEADGLEWGTLKQRRTLCRLHIKPLLGDRRLARLTVPDIEAFRDALVESRPRVTASKTVRALSSVLIEAMRRGLLGQNVATNVKVKN